MPEPIIDSVSETSSAAADLDAWANQPDPAPAADEGAAAAEAAAGPAPKAGAKPAGKPPSADAIARAAQKGKDAQAPAPVAAKPAAVQPSRPYDPAAKVKIVVDGEEEEITIEEALRRARKSSASDRRFQEAARLRQEAEALRPLDAFREVFSLDDIETAKAALKAEGREPTAKAVRAKVAELAVLAEIERERLEKENPAELKRRDLEAELARRDAAERQRKAQEEQAETEKRREAVRESYNKKFTAALTAHDLPATPYTVMRMAELEKENLRMGLELTAEEMAPLVKEDLAKEQAATIAKMTPEQAVKYLPKAFLDALRKYDLAAVKAGTARPAPPPPLARRAPTARPQKFTKAKDADAALEAWAAGR